MAPSPQSHDGFAILGKDSCVTEAAPVASVLRLRPHIQAIDYVNYCALHPLFEPVKPTASHALLGSVLMSLIPLCLLFRCLNRSHCGSYHSGLSDA